MAGRQVLKHDSDAKELDSASAQGGVEGEVLTCLWTTMTQQVETGRSVAGLGWGESGTRVWSSVGLGLDRGRC